MNKFMTKAIILFTITTFSNAIFALENNGDANSLGLERLSKLESSIKSETQKLFENERLAYKGVSDKIQSTLSIDDESNCLKGDSDSCARIESDLKNLVVNEFEINKLNTDEFDNFISSALTDLFQIRRDLEVDENVKLSTEFDKKESDLIYLTSKADIHRKGTTAFVLSSMLIFDSHMHTGEDVKISIKQIEDEMVTETEGLLGLQEYVLNN
jgi:hypothetical protein